MLFISSLESHLPPRYRPYFRLMRLHQPTGMWLLLFPCWWGITMATKEEGYIAAATLMVVFAVGAIVMRGAGCVINDLWDRDIDAKVARTRNRPLANGELSTQQAYKLLGGLLCIGLLLLLSLPATAILLGIASMALVVVYPLMKRLTFWPQAFLGLTFNWGALMGWASVTGEINLPAVLLYAGGFFWTLYYDTIYAFQDTQDDSSAGVKSTALYFGPSARRYLSLFYQATMIFLFVAGIITHVNILFYLVMIGAFYYLFRLTEDVDLDKPADCKRAFDANIWVGWIVLGAIIAGKI